MNTTYILKSNTKFSIRLSSISCVPVYGPIIANWLLGFPLGLLVKYKVSDLSRTSLITLTSLFVHGIPEFIGFILIENTSLMLQCSLINLLRGKIISWNLITYYGFISFGIGYVILVLAAVVEGYLTPVAVEILLRWME